MLAANTKTINTFKNKNAKLNMKLKQNIKRKTKAIFGESTLRHAKESEDEMTFFLVFEKFAISVWRLQPRISTEYFVESFSRS